MQALRTHIREQGQVAFRCIQLEIVSTYHGSLEYKEAVISVDTEKPYVTTISWGVLQNFP